MNPDKTRRYLLGFSFLLVSIAVVSIIVAVSSMLYFKPDEEIIQLIQKCMKECKSVTIRAYWGDELTDERKLMISDDTKKSILVKLLPPDPPGLIKSAATKAHYKFQFDCGQRTIEFGYMKGLGRVRIGYNFLLKKGGKVINVNSEFCMFLDSLIEQAKMRVFPQRDGS